MVTSHTTYLPPKSAPISPGTIKYSYTVHSLYSKYTVLYLLPYMHGMYRGAVYSCCSSSIIVTATAGILRAALSHTSA